MDHTSRNRKMKMSRRRDEVRARWVFRKQSTEQQSSNPLINRRFENKLTTETELDQPSTSAQLPIYPQAVRRVPYNLFALRYLITGRTQSYNRDVAEALFN